MAIIYSNNDTRYRFGNRRVINRWLKGVAQSEGFQLVDLGVIFCSSEQLLQINREFLAHDYFTDIITFDNSDLEEGYVAGELYIDVETVSDNAKQFGAAELDEMHRILVHGVLHLCGQGDKSEDDAKQMRAKEDRYLAQLEDIIYGNR